MKVKVLYNAQLRDILGFGTEEVELLESASVEQLLEQLGQKHGSPFEEYVWESPSKMRSSIFICVGDNSIGRDLTVSLEAGNLVTLLSPVSGG